MCVIFKGISKAGKQVRKPKIYIYSYFFYSNVIINKPRRFQFIYLNQRPFSKRLLFRRFGRIIFAQKMLKGFQND